MNSLLDKPAAAAKSWRSQIFGFAFEIGQAPCARRDRIQYHPRPFDTAPRAENSTSRPCETRRSHELSCSYSSLFHVMDDHFRLATIIGLSDSSILLPASLIGIGVPSGLAACHAHYQRTVSMWPTGRNLCSADNLFAGSRIWLLQEYYPIGRRGRGATNRDDFLLIV